MWVSRISSTRSGPPSSCQSPSRGLVQPHQRGIDTKRWAMPRLSASLHRLDGVVAAVGIAGIVGLAHAADQMADAAPIGDAAAKVRNTRLRPGTKVVGRPARRSAMATSRSARCRRSRPTSESPGCGSSPSAAAQSALERSARLEQAVAAVELDRVTLTIVEAHHLDPPEALQRPGQAGRGILAAGEQHQRGFVAGLRSWGALTISPAARPIGGMRDRRARFAGITARLAA